MGWNKVYILIMGSIRSFDGRNCEWLIKYPRAVSGAHGAHSVATPWPAYIKVVAVKPGRAVPDGLLLSPSRSVKAHISGDGHAKIASWRPCPFDCLRSFAKLEPRVGQ